MTKPPEHPPEKTDSPGAGRERTELEQGQYRDGGNLGARQALHARYGSGNANWFHWVFDHLPRADRLEVLELGAGPGRLWTENIDRVPEGWRVLVTDLSQGMLAEAQAMLDRHPRFSFRRVDAQAISCDTGSFDVVIANHMLYHVPEIDLALTEFRRVLRPGGTLLAATNGEAHMKELDELARAALPADLAALASWREETSGFRLENGKEMLVRRFDHVERFDMDSPLVVPDAAPLVAYLASLGDLQRRLADEDSRVRERLLSTATDRLQSRIARLGAVRITRSTGLFVAR